ncbi:hypothetical protein FQN57_002092 [Myotisia sp. PD_48]|nr:hypothetical protein FQN57_002092 [Myotisia sp. PD_48]
MSENSKPKGSSIPSWQLGLATQKAEPASPVVTENKPDTSDEVAEGKDTLLEQAKRFLQDESIRDAPTDRKIAFLESKGVSNDDIQSLLGDSRNQDATSDTAGEASLATAKTESSTTTTTTTAPSSPSVQTSSSSPSLAQTNPASSPATSGSRTRDLPPVISYPEFLFQESKPPPLISFQNVVYTLYGAAGLAATVYGASEYLVKPMLESLTSARQELAETTQAHLNTLNQKLERTVSIIPPISTSKTSSQDKQLDDEDTKSVSSEANELFHRDIATQTTPELNSYPSIYPAVVNTADESDGVRAQKRVNDHHSRIESISAQLNSVLSAEKSTDMLYETARDSVSELQSYLDGLMYSTTYLNTSLYGYGDDKSGDKKTGVTSGEDDAIAAFKAEVRSVKGTLLSARNFPLRRGGYRPGMGGR